MKAIAYRKYGSPDVLQLWDVPQPSPKDNEVLIQVHVAAVTTADVAARKGSPFITRLTFGLWKPKLSILGTEFAGTIAAVGPSVTRIAPKPSNLNFVCPSCETMAKFNRVTGVCSSNLELVQSLGADK